MIRQLTLLSVAICFAAGGNLSFAGPNIEPNDLLAVPSQNPWNASVALAGSKSIPEQDVKDFMLPDWQQADPATDAFSQMTSPNEIPLYSPLTFVATPDSDTLSIPEVPLPPAVIPGLIGVGLAAFAHHRSQRNRKML